MPSAGRDCTDKILHDVVELTPKFKIIDAASSGDNTIVAAVAGKKIRVLNFVLVGSAAITTRFESAASGTALTGQMTMAAGSVIASGYCKIGHFETLAGELLNLELSGANTVDGYLVYVEVPA